MARIRTIKPEFFTSEDIVSLTPLARLFYVSLWCEADRQGRLEWKPRTLKFRYLPGDDCDIEALAGELTGAGLLVLYEVHGKLFAEIPTFKKHQIINNRESPSVLPARQQDVVDACPTRAPLVTTREKQPFSNIRNDASGTRESRVKAEGKEGKEGKDSVVPLRDTPPPSTSPPADEPEPLVGIPLVDGTEFAVTPKMAAEWIRAYPAVDVEQQLREMRTWSLANSSMRKTRRGVQSFIVRWLGKEQDSGRGARRGPEAGRVGSFV